MVSKQFSRPRRSEHLRRRARLAMQGRTKKSYFFGWFRARDASSSAFAAHPNSSNSVERQHRAPLSTGTKIVLILAVVVFLFIALIPFLAMIKLLFTPG